MKLSPSPSAEAVQVYVRSPASSSIGRPVRELKGHEKTMLQPGEARELLIATPVGLAMSFWDEGHGGWLSETGTHVVEVVETGEGNMLAAPLSVQVSRY
jgi:beta-glucosidase